MSKIFLFIPTKSIGGAEKRMLQFWAHSKKHTSLPLKLIISPQLYALVNSINELKLLNSYNNDIIVEAMDFENAYQFSSRAKQIITRQTTQEDIIHFVSSYPIFNRIGRRTLFTFTESSLNNVNFKGKLGYWWNFMKANTLDILDPIVYRKLKTLPYFNGKVKLTPNSFTDETFYKQVRFEEKKNYAVHLGRYVPGKRIDTFLKSLPVIDGFLKTKGINDAEYFVVGYGELEKQFKEIVSSPSYQNIKCHFFFTENPQEILAKSKIILSIQANNNYPSKSLLEGIACANIPVITDVGTTRLIARPEYSNYLSNDFSAEEMAKAFYEVFSMPDIDFMEKTSKGIEYIKANFKIETMAEYYYALYQKLSERSS